MTTTTPTPTTTARWVRIAELIGRRFGVCWRLR